MQTLHIFLLWLITKELDSFYCCSKVNSIKYNKFEIKSKIISKREKPKKKKNVIISLVVAGHALWDLRDFHTRTHFVLNHRRQPFHIFKRKSNWFQFQVFMFSPKKKPNKIQINRHSSEKSRTKELYRNSPIR